MKRRVENIFLEKFRKVSFTKNQKRIAQYCIDHQMELSQKTLREVADEARVSEVTVLNFVRKLGYEGFSEFKSWAYEQLTQQLNDNNRFRQALGQRLDANTQNRSNASILESHIHTVMRAAETSLIQNKPEAYQKAADLLVSSRHVFVAGLRSLRGEASRFALGLQYPLDHVTYLDYDYTGLMQALSGTTAGDTLVLFCFARYYLPDIALCKMVRDAGLKLILISDSAISPLANYADILLVVSTESVSFFNSCVGLIAVTEYLIALIVDKAGEEVKGRWKEIDTYLDKFRT